MNKRTLKALIFLGIIIAINLTFTTISNATISISTSKSSVSPGETFSVTVSVKSNEAGNIKLQASNATLSDNNLDLMTSSSATVSCTAGSSGTITINASGKVANYDSETEEIQSASPKTINIVTQSNPTTPTTPTNPATPAAKSNNASLSNLVISPVDFKGFKASKTTGYSVTVENDVTEVGVKATAQHSKAKVEISGNKNLKVGENIVSVTVTAEDGKTKKTYKVIVNRKNIAENTTPVETEPEQEPETEPEEETSVEEKVLGISQIKITGTTGDEKSVELTFTPEFNSDIYEYTTIVPVEIKDINVEAKASIEDAAIEVMGNKDLVLGENVITILVKSADGTEQKSYQIIVTKTTESLKQDHTELIKKIIIITTITILVIAIIIAITVFKRGKKSQKIGTIGRDISIADEMLGKEDQEIKKEEKPSSNDGNHGKRFK